MKNLSNFIKESIDEAFRINKNTKLKRHDDNLPLDILCTIGCIYEGDVDSEEEFVKFLINTCHYTRSQSEIKTEQLMKLIKRHVEGSDYTSFTLHASNNSFDFFKQNSHKLNGHEIKYDGYELPEQLHWYCKLFSIGFMNNGDIEIYGDDSFDLTIECK